MTAKVFVDSNIWLYAFVNQRDDPRHESAATFLLNLGTPVINSQVIREVCSNLIKKIKIPEDYLRVLINAWYQDCEVIHCYHSQHLLASKLRVSCSLSYWDSLIVAAALDAGCTTLYSEDLQHGQVFEYCLTVVNPLVE
ncbi:MAG: PIN domain-containing protein [Methylococcales bacterium]